MKNRLLVLLIVTAMFLAGLSGIAFAGRQVLPVPAFSQQPYGALCWATAASMVIAFGKNDPWDRKVDIAKMVHGENFNQGGTPQNIRDAVWTYLRWAGSIQNNPLSYTAVQYQTNDPNGRPIVAGMTYGPHALTIRGYDTSTNYVLYCDPWDGTYRGRTYNGFVLGDTGWGAWNYSVFWK